MTWRKTSGIPAQLERETAQLVWDPTVHDFNPPWPRIVGPLFARSIVGDFIHNIAGKTLRRIKELVEVDDSHEHLPQQPQRT